MPEYTMALSREKDRLKAFSIVPFKISSMGVIFNCATRSATMESLTCASDCQLLVIFRAKRRIHQG